MTKKEVANIVEKAVKDLDFRSLLESDFENVVKHYLLTEEEKKALKTMNQEELPKMSVPNVPELGKCRQY